MSTMVVNYQVLSTMARSDEKCQQWLAIIGCCQQWLGVIRNVNNGWQLSGAVNNG